MIYQVVEISAPDRPLLKTTSLNEALRAVRKHPERGILRGVRRPTYVPYANTEFKICDW